MNIGILMFRTLKKGLLLIRDPRFRAYALFCAGIGPQGKDSGIWRFGPCEGFGAVVLRIWSASAGLLQYARIMNTRIIL